MDPSAPAKPAPHASLSSRLLVLTIFFIMVSEVLIYAPSIARYRKSYLESRIGTAHLATLALEATPDRMVGRTLESQLLFHADAYAIALQDGDRRMMALRAEDVPMVERTFDLRRMTFFGWIGDAFESLARDGNRIIRVIGPSPKDPDVLVEVVLDEAPMRAAMYGYSTRILQLSMFISVVTGGLVYLSMQWLAVRPFRRLTENMTLFRADPEDDRHVIRPSGRRDEVGLAERELATMQTEVQSALRQKNRLAALGGAVAKINHDLRNTLATAVLVSDHLTNIDDPEVRRVTPRLYDAIDRAVGLCSQTLDYVADRGPSLRRERFYLGDAIDEILVTAITVRNDIDPDLAVFGDPVQLGRAFDNLIRNAEQAGAKEIRVSAVADDDGAVTVTLADDGPGLPPRAREKLFQPFAGSTRKGGTGLGLIIVRDIARAHGGELELADTGSGGTTFRFKIAAGCNGT